MDEAYLVNLLPHLPAGDSELYSHPSLDEFKHEFDALISPRTQAVVEALGIKLIRYGIYDVSKILLILIVGLVFEAVGVVFFERRPQTDWRIAASHCGRNQPDGGARRHEPKYFGGRCF